MTKICFIVEGYTEELFVKQALIDYINNKTQVNFEYSIVPLTGGVTLDRIKSIIHNKATSYDIVTTFIDLVGLSSAKISDYANIIRSNVRSAEKATSIAKIIHNSCAKHYQYKIIIHLQPYEFEALCFANPEAFCYDPKIKNNIDKIRKESREYSNCEEINNTNYPSKRLQKYYYSKAGTLFSQFCDIDEILSNCPHFKCWVEKLIDVINTLPEFSLYNN